MDHFTRPRNVGAVEGADGKGSGTNPSCGDRTTITLRVRDGRVSEARFRTFGCSAAIAAASALTELATGLAADNAARLEPSDVLRALDGLPPRKEACALMAVGALRAALIDSKTRSTSDPPALPGERAGVAAPGSVSDRASIPPRGLPSGKNRLKT